MKGIAYSNETKQQVLRKVEETGDMTLVARNHNIPVSTVSTWIRKRKQYGSSSRWPKSENFNSVKASKEVEKENETLKKLLGEKDLEIAILKDLLKNEPTIKDRYCIAREYINAGYKAVAVLKYAGLSKSTYYYT